MRSKYVLNKNNKDTNPDLRTQTHKFIKKKKKNQLINHTTLNSPINQTHKSSKQTNPQQTHKPINFLGKQTHKKKKKKKKKKPKKLSSNTNS